MCDEPSACNEPEQAYDEPGRDGQRNLWSRAGPCHERERDPHDPGLTMDAFHNGLSLGGAFGVGSSREEI